MRSVNGHFQALPWSEKLKMGTIHMHIRVGEPYIHDKSITSGFISFFVPMIHGGFVHSGQSDTAHTVVFFRFTHIEDSDIMLPNAIVRFVI